MVCVDDMPKNTVDRADNHLFELIEGKGVLALVQVGRAEEDKDVFNAGHYCSLNPEYIEEINIDHIVNLNEM
jgi:hypothetical protein